MRYLNLQTFNILITTTIPKENIKNGVYFFVFTKAKFKWGKLLSHINLTLSESKCQTQNVMIFFYKHPSISFVFIFLDLQSQYHATT